MSSTPETINEPECDCWQDMERSEKISKLWNDNILVDCTFLVGPENTTPEKITGHKVMFILESPVFEKMLTGNFMEVENKHEIRIIDFLPKDFKNFRFLIYHNDYKRYSTFSLEESFEIYRIADKYLVSSITKNCIKYWKSHVIDSTHIDTLITLFEYAHQLLDTSLLDAIYKELHQRRNTNKNLISEKLNDLTLDVFYKYILILSTKSPLLVFNAINSYFEKNDLIKVVELHKTVKLEEITDEDLKKKLAFRNNILRLVKFKEMTPTEFLDGPGKSNLLGWQEKYEMISLLTGIYLNSLSSCNRNYTITYYNNIYKNYSYINTDHEKWNKFFPQIEL